MTIDWQYSRQWAEQEHNDNVLQQVMCSSLFLHLRL